MNGAGALVALAITAAALTGCSTDADATEPTEGDFGPVPYPGDAPEGLGCFRCGHDPTDDHNPGGCERCDCSSPFGGIT